MSLFAYLVVVRRRAWIIALCAVVAPGVAYFLSSRQTAQYSSRADVYINQQNLASALTGIDTSGLSSGQPQSTETLASLAAIPDVAVRALRLAKLHDRSPQALLGQTSITANANTNILDFSVTDPSPATAELLATSYAQAFTLYRSELQAQPIIRARHDLEAALAKLDAGGQKSTALRESLQEKDQTLQTLQTLQTSGAVVIRRADLGTQVSPHPRRDTAVGLALGLLLGLAFAFAAEALDTRIRSTGELGDLLGGLPLLARVPPPAKKVQERDELVMIAQPKHQSAEAFRLLRANLEFVRLGGGDVRTIIVTSAAEREGKSTTAANLAVAAARAGKKVALVDLDLRRPYLDRFFRLTLVDGVTDVLLGRLPLERALQRIDLDLGTAAARRPEPNGNGNGAQMHAAETGVLDVLVSGPLPPNPGEFVGLPRLADVIARLREAYEMVLIDSPPLLRVGDALTLASQADGLLVVARLKLLRRPMVRELRRLLAGAPALKLGYVVTGPVPGESDSEAYGYGYGHTYQATRERDEGEQQSHRAFDSILTSAETAAGGKRRGDGR